MIKAGECSILTTDKLEVVSEILVAHCDFKEGVTCAPNRWGMADMAGIIPALCLICTANWMMFKDHWMDGLPCFWTKTHQHAF